MLQKKFDKTSLTINRVLRSVGMSYFLCIHVMPKPLEPDNMQIEDNFDIHDFRKSCNNTKEKNNKLRQKSVVSYDIPQHRPKKSYTRSAVAKSSLKKVESFSESPVRKNTKVNELRILQTILYSFHPS